MAIAAWDVERAAGTGTRGQAAGARGQATASLVGTAQVSPLLPPPPAHPPKIAEPFFNGLTPDLAGPGHAAPTEAVAGDAEPTHTAARHAVPGLALTTIAVAIAWAANRAWPALSPLTAAVVLGVLVANVLPRPFISAAQPGSALAAKRMMRAGIVLLGLQLALGDVLKLGWQTLVLVVVVVFATFFGTHWLGRRIGLPGRQPLLIATGFAICGASAVAAMESVTRRGDDAREAEQDPDPLVAVTLVTLCGSLAILVLPLLKAPLGLSEVQFGHWVGASVHDVGQVVATAGTAGAAALQPAVVVKLMRVAMLAPMVAGAALVERRRVARASGGGGAAGPASSDGIAVGHEPQGSAAVGHAASGATATLPPIIPLFVVGFLLMIVLRSTGRLPAAAVADAKQAQDLLLAAGMFGLGSGVRVRELARTGVRPVLLGLASWVLIAAVAYIGVRVGA